MWSIKVSSASNFYLHINLSKSKQSKIRLVGQRPNWVNNVYGKSVDDIIRVSRIKFEYFEINLNTTGRLLEGNRSCDIDITNTAI